MTNTSLTFADVKAFVSKDKGSDSKLIGAADLLLGTVLLLGPTVAGLPLTVISASLGLLGAKNELVKSERVNEFETGGVRV
jgi:hypothetical protein